MWPEIRFGFSGSCRGYSHDTPYRASGWEDILTGVGGVTYTNDTIGNRLTDGTWTYTWEHGRQLSQVQICV